MTDQLSNGRLLHQQQGIKIYENKLFRWLCFDDEKAIQSCMSLQEPTQLNLAYQPFMMMWQLLLQGTPHAACLLGLGGGDIVRYFRKQFPETKLLIVEQDPIVAKLASEHFFIKPDQHHLTVEIADAVVFIQKQQQHDLVFIDIVADNQLPQFLYTEDFWKHCRQCLSGKGVVMMNVIPESDAVFLNLLTILRKIFGHVPLCMGVPDHKNVVLLLSRSIGGLPSLSELKQRSQVLQRQSELPFEQCVSVLEKDNQVVMDKNHR